MLIKADLHIHSKYSEDGALELDTILRTAKKRGIGAVAVADHNTCEMLKEIRLRMDAGGCVDGIVVVPAAEISTDAGHVLALFIEREIDFTRIEKMGEVYNISAVVAAVKDAGGIAVLAHPFGKPAWKPEAAGEQLFDGVECHNARAASMGIKTNEEAVRLAFGYHAIFTAGSDAHFAGEIGNSYIEFNIKNKTLADVKAAVLGKQGTVWGRESAVMYRGLSQVCRRMKAGQLYLVPKRLLVMGYQILIDIAKTARLLKKDRGSKMIDGGNMNVGDR